MPRDPFAEAYGGASTDTYNPDLTSQLEKAYGHSTFQANDDPQHGAPMYTPNQKYNVTDASHINRDADVTNTGWDNLWNDTKNSFYDAMLTTKRGKSYVGATAGLIPWGDYEGPEAIIDTYPDKVAALDAQLAKGLIDQVDYNTQKTVLDTQKATAQPILDSYKEDIANYQAKIDSNPVARDYKLNQMLTAGAGDEASLWNKLKYGTSSNVGSSVGFMLPAFAATFGNKLVQNLSETAILNVFPEAGVPADIAAGLLALGGSVAEIMAQRNLESYAEIDKPVQEMRTQLVAEYMQAHSLTSANDIPEDDMRKIRNQSRQGAEQQFRENSMLGATDFAKALLLPGSNIGYGLGKYLGSAHEALNLTENLAEHAAEYGRMARLATKVGLGYAETELGGYEMGFRTAAQARATEADQTVMTPNEQKKYNGMSNVLHWALKDGYDVATSMDLIPTVAGSNLGGKYSENKEFQESVWGGQFLAGAMSAPLFAYSIAKDMAAYRAANNDLQNNGLVDIDGKYKRVQNDIMIKYFDKGQVQQLGEAINAQAKGDNPTITKEQALESIDKMKKAYDLYQGISDRVDGIKTGDKINGTLDLGFKKFEFGDPQVRAAKAKVKADYLSEIMNVQDKTDELAQLEIQKNEQYLQDRSVFETDHPEALDARMDIEARKESIERMRQAYEKYQKRGPSFFGAYENYMDRLSEMEDQMIEESKQLGEVGEANEHLLHFSPSPKMQAIYDKINANHLFLQASTDKVDKLNNIKTKDDLLRYTQQNINRPVPPNSTIAQDEQTEVSPEAVADKIKNDPSGATLTDDEKVWRNDPTNAQAVEDVLKTTATQEATPEPTEPFSEDELDFNSVFSNPNKISRALAFKEVLGYDATEKLDDDFTFPNVHNGLKNIYKNHPEVLRNNFNILQDTYRSINTSSPIYELGADDTLYVTPGVPPTQSDDISVSEDNRKIIGEEAAELDLSGIGNKITSGLSLAQLNILQDKTTGKNAYKAGELQFSEQIEQHLINTNVIKTGDVLEVSVDSIPHDFDYENTSDENYDRVQIGVYKEVAHGAISQKKLIAHLHLINNLQLPDVDRNGNPFDKEAEYTLLRVNRRSVIEGHRDNSNHTVEYKILSKGFGYLNTNDRGVMSTVKAAIGSDTRPIFTHANENGEPVGLLHASPIASKGDIQPGALLLLIPNETNNGTVYVPIYMNKRQLKGEVDKTGEPAGIYAKVVNALLDYVSTGSWKARDKAAPYVFLTSNEEMKGRLGAKGIYAAKREGRVEVWINDKPFTKDNINGLKEAVGETYISFNKEFARNDEYQQELMTSPLVQTNLVANPVLLSKYNNKQGDYKFLEDNQQYSYFSQHTLVVGPKVEEVHTPITATEAREEDIDDVLSRFDDVDVLNGPRPGKLAQVLAKRNDDISTAKSDLLVSDDIPPSLQAEMVEALAYNLVNAERPDDKDVDKIKNTDRAKAWVKNEVNKLTDTHNKIKGDARYPAETVAKVAAGLRNFQLFDTHIDALLDKASKFIEGLGFKFNEDTDYYENLEEQGEQNAFNEFDDDSSRKRDPWTFAPKEVKKILWFIPKLQELNDAFEVDREYMDREVRAGRPKPTYRAIMNSLGLPTFNNVRDTWEKILEITSSRFFDNNDTGYMKMLTMLQDTTNAPVVQEFSKRLQTSAEQVKTAFFKASKLQKQNNKTSLYDTRDNVKGGTKRFTTVVDSNRRQGIRATFNNLKSEFLNTTTGILIPVQDEATGSRIYNINTEFAKGIRKSIIDIIDNDGSYRASMKGDRKEGAVLTDVAKKQIHQLINQAGINISLNTLDDVLRNYKTEAGLNLDKSIVRELFISRILRRLAGEVKTSSRQQTEESVEGEDAHTSDLKANNPFHEERKAMNTLASYEHKHRVNTQAGAYRDDNGDSYYSFVRPNYLSDKYLQMREFKETGTDMFIRATVRTDDYASTSLYLNGLLDPRIDMGLEMFYELGARNMVTGENSKMLKDMNPREHQVTKMALFQNKGSWKGYYLYDTLSDKTTKPEPTALKYDISGLTYTHPTLINLPKEALERIYNAHITNEIKRINNTIDQNKTLQPHQMIKGYHGEKGMGQYFLTHYYLNKAFLESSSPKLAIDMYNEDGSIKKITSDVKDRILREMNNHINNIIQASKQDLKEFGVYNLDATVVNKFTKKEEPMPNLTDLVEHNYMFDDKYSVMSKLGLEDVKGIKDAKYKGDWRNVPRDVMERIVDYVTADFVYNSIVNSSEMLQITGDPAQAGKLASGEDLSTIKDKYKNNVTELNKQVLLANIQATLTNLNKRNASFLASGEGGKFKDSHYNLVIAKDVSIDSAHYEYYESLFGEEMAKAYKNGDLTDAQEMTTVKEFLTVMQAYGKIDENKYTKALYELDRDQWHEDLARGLIKDIKPTSTEREDLRRLVLQPQKPVQRTANLDADMRMSKQYYVKTSAYPLVPDMLQGSMKDFLQDMKKNDVHRVSFVTGVKQGVAGAADMFNKDGSYNTAFFENNKNTLNRNGFRIQLEVPFEENHDHIREGTQQSKILFVDVHDDTPLLFKGSQVTAKELKDKYVDYHRKIVDIQKEDTMKDLGVTEIGGVMNRNLKKMSSMLVREGQNSGFSMDSLMKLGLNKEGNFKYPLTFLPEVGQVEPLLTAVMSNNITRLKMPGGSYIQGSEVMLRTGRKGRVESGDNLKDRDNRGILWTKPEYEHLEKLSFLHKEGDVIHPSQIVMPFYFNKDGKRLSMMDYTKTVDGKTFLDTDKIDPELLQMNGFRIPYQGLNSGMWFEIVGFLPMTSGDLILVPGEIAAQMGSDYDVDKLYSYMYNYKHEDGRITKIEAEIPTTKEELQNGLIDIQKSIYTASDEAIHKAILKPLSFDDIKATVKYLGIDARRPFLGNFDPLYQRDVYFSNSTGKLGTAISANANTSHALSQGTNLYVKGQGILFLDEKGNDFDDHMTQDASLITSGDANRLKKKEQFDKIISTYRSNLQGKTMEYYENEIASIRDAFDKHAWSDETLKSEQYTKFRENLELTEDISTDPAETAKELHTMVGDFVHLLKYNSAEDNELLTARTPLRNENAVNRTYSDTYTYFDEGKEKDIDQNSKGNGSWRLDKVYTHPDPHTGEVYRISDLISQVLGVSVDNAKEQVLGALGVNEVNFNTSLLILRSGFGPNIMGAFINQPILKEYYTKVGEADDIYRVDYTPNKKQAAIDGLFTKYSDMYGIKENVQGGPSFEGFKLSDMKSWLSMGITAKNAREQLYVLKAFLRYKDIADSLQTLTTNFNIDAKGLPKNMSETATKADVIDNTGDSPNLGNIDNYRTNTIPGMFLGVPRLAQRIFMGETSPLFAYDTPAYRSNMETILGKLGRTMLRQEDVDKINNHTKMFIYSGFGNMSPEQITDLRRRLLFDTPENESMQTRLSNLTSKYPRNEFLQAVREVGSIYPDNPKLVEIPTGSDEDYVQKTKELWQQAINGADPDLSTFAKDLVAYALYVSPQEYGQSNIMKYVPGQHLDTLDMPTYLHRINNSLRDDESLIHFPDQYIQHSPNLATSAREQHMVGGSIIRDNSKAINAFTLPSLSTEAKENQAQSLVRATKEGIKYYPEYLTVYNNKDIGKQLYRASTNVDGSVTYFRVEKMGMNGMTEYSFNGAVRTLVDTQKLDFGEPQDSSVVASIMGATPFEADEMERGEYLTEKNNGDQIMDGIIRTDDEIMTNPGTTQLNKQYAQLYRWLARQMQYQGLDKTSIVIDPTHPTAGTTSGNTVTFNPIKMMGKSTGLSAELEKQRVILHEMTHVLMNKALRERHNTPEYKAIQDVWNAYKDNIYKDNKDETRGIPTNTLNAELFKLLKEKFDVRSLELNTADFMRHTSHILNDPETFKDLMKQLGQSLEKLHTQGKIKDANFDLSKDDSPASKERFNAFKEHIVDDFMSNIATMKNKYYSYYDMSEFVPEALTNKEMQDELKSMPSLWSRLVSAIKDFLASIFGVESDERTLLDDSFDAIFNFLKPGDKDVSSQDSIFAPEVKDDITTEYHLDTYIDKLIEQGFIKKKC